MLHERALKLLASWEGLGGRELDQTAQLKFQYVVSCQAYGNHKKSRDLKAADTEFLLQRYPSLRVAYVDKASSLTKVSETDGRAALKEAIRFYSVLMKGVRSETGEALVQEIYRVQLPGDIMLGEGKPENQNHAMIFTRGEALQTIDMNQCGYLEEALKMRNLLCEFRTHPDAPHAPTILGFREHIFTGTSKQLSSLASYMALQEGCFVTLTQRVLWNPLQVRLHYGHPDVFDKLFSMTRGGVSKASRGINLSEDIYAGFNHLLRGATIPYIEYVQVGKGRDVGMQQIYKFEAKLASGNAEQCLSRDVYRIGQRLDFMRLLSFYYSGPGFYFNNACTVFAMFVFLYLQLWSHILQLDAEVPHADLLNAQWVLQLGLLLTVPIICYLAVEHGLWHSVSKFVETFLTGSPLFFMFHMGTKAHYYDSTLKYGGAKYRPTGRGFVLQHEDFAELYRFHSASHLYNGFELLWGLLLLMTLGDWWWKGDGPDLGGGGMGQYWRTTWSLWAVMIAWLFAPFWFNPLAFDQGKLRQDVQAWLMWMRRKDGNPLTSWEAWYEEEHSYTTTGSWMKRLHIVSPGIRYGLTFIGLLAALSEQKLHDGVLLELQAREATLPRPAPLAFATTSLAPTSLRPNPDLAATSAGAWLARRRSGRAATAAAVQPMAPAALASRPAHRLHLFAHRRHGGGAHYPLVRLTLPAAPPFCRRRLLPRRRHPHPLHVRLPALRPATHAGVRLPLRRPASRSLPRVLGAAVLPRATDQVAALRRLRAPRRAQRDHAAAADDGVSSCEPTLTARVASRGGWGHASEARPPRDHVWRGAPLVVAYGAARPLMRDERSRQGRRPNGGRRKPWHDERSRGGRGRRPWKLAVEGGQQRQHASMATIERRPLVEWWAGMRMHWVAVESVGQHRLGAPTGKGPPTPGCFEDGACGANVRAWLYVERHAASKKCGSDAAGSCSEISAQHSNSKQMSNTV